MRFIPDYRVSYKGVFYECDKEFDIDPADAEEMREHGEIVDDLAEENQPAEGKPARGRPPKKEESR